MLSGMIPVLFAENPSEAEKGLLKDLISARKDLDRINRAFFIPEAVDLENALKVVKKPRVGEAEYAFKERNLDRLFEPRRFPPGLILLIKKKKSPYNLFLSLFSKFFISCQMLWTLNKNSWKFYNFK